MGAVEYPKVKPTQRCSCCGQVVKKPLSERMLMCATCGYSTTRDRNTTPVMPRYVLEGEYGSERAMQCKPQKVSRTGGSRFGCSSWIECCNDATLAIAVYRLHARDRHLKVKRIRLACDVDIHKPIGDCQTSLSDKLGQFG